MNRRIDDVDEVYFQTPDYKVKPRDGKEVAKNNNSMYEVGEKHLEVLNNTNYNNNYYNNNEDNFFTELIIDNNSKYLLDNNNYSPIPYSNNLKTQINNSGNNLIIDKINTQFELNELKTLLNNLNFHKWLKGYIALNESQNLSIFNDCFDNKKENERAHFLKNLKVFFCKYSLGSNTVIFEVQNIKYVDFITIYKGVDILFNKIELVTLNGNDDIKLGSLLITKEVSEIMFMGEKYIDVSSNNIKIIN